MDEFIDIIDYEGLYKINKNGDVYGVKNKKIRKNHLDNSIGYYTIGLNKNNKSTKHYIHRLIALHFIPNDDENKNYVDHIDGVITNNNISNLRWVRKIDNDRNRIGNVNYICQYIRKNGKINYEANYPIYINDKRINKRKCSIYRHIVEEWLEKIKKEYPNQYTGGRI